MNAKIIIELCNGKIAGIYGSDPNMEIKIYEDLGELTDEQEDEIEQEAATVPYVLYPPSSVFV